MKVKCSDNVNVRNKPWLCDPLAFRRWTTSLNPSFWLWMSRLKRHNLFLGYSEITLQPQPIARFCRSKSMASPQSYNSKMAQKVRGNGEKGRQCIPWHLCMAAGETKQKSDHCLESLLATLSCIWEQWPIKANYVLLISLPNPGNGKEKYKVL